MSLFSPLQNLAHVRKLRSIFPIEVVVKGGGALNPNIVIPPFTGPKFTRSPDLPGLIPFP